MPLPADKKLLDEPFAYVHTEQGRPSINIADMASGFVSMSQDTAGYIADNFLQNTQNRHPIAYPWATQYAISHFNSSRLNEYIREYTRPSLVQIMACHLIGAKPYCSSDHCEHTSVKSKSKYNNFYTRKCIWKCSLQNGSHFVWEYFIDCFKTTGP